MSWTSWTSLLLAKEMPGLSRAAVATAAAATLATVIYLRRKRIRRAICDALDDAMLASAWEQMPERIILLRHGESEANVDSTILAHKADNLIELTEKGREYKDAAVTVGLKAVTAVVTTSTSDSGPVVADVRSKPNGRPSCMHPPSPRHPCRLPPQPAALTASLTPTALGVRSCGADLSARG